MATKKKTVKKMGSGGSPMDTTAYKNRKFDPKKPERTSPMQTKPRVIITTKVKKKKI